MFVDGLRSTFMEVSADLESGYDVAVRAESPFGDGSNSGRIPVNLAEELRAVEGVEFVQPRVVDFTVVANDADGKGALANNAPNIGTNWESDNPEGRLRLTQGRAPTTDTEFAIDSDAYDQHNFSLDNSFTVTTPAGSRELVLVGVFDYGSEGNNTLGGRVVAFENTAAVTLLNSNSGYDDLTIGVSGDSAEFINRVQPILDKRELGLKALSRDEVTGQRQDSFQKIVDILRTVLLAFAGIVLAVSSLLVYNVFNITLEQRIKELGMLRAIGASGKQITRMMILESFALSIVATGIGIFAGRYLASILRSALAIFGFPGDLDLPLQPRTLIYAVAVGVGVTQIAAIWPAIRARRISPMAAITSQLSATLDARRNLPLGVLCLLIAAGLTWALYGAQGWFELTVVPLTTGLFLYLGLSWFGKLGRLVAPVILLLYGLWLLAAVWLSASSLTETFTLLAVGATITILGLSRVSAVSARPFSHIAGHYPTAFIVWVCALISALLAGVVSPGTPFSESSPFRSTLFLFVLALMLVTLSYGLLRTTLGAFGVTGYLARKNAARNPQRTASTSTALMIGLALMTATSVIGDSIKSSVALTLGSAVTADWFVQGPKTGDQGLPFSTNAASQISEIPEVSDVLSYRFSRMAFTLVVGTESNPPNAETVKGSVPEIFEVLSTKDEAATDALTKRIGARSIQIESALGTNTEKLDRHINADFVARDDSLAPKGLGIYLEEDQAQSQNLGIGSTTVAVFPNGDVVELTVTGIYRDGSLLGNRVIDFELWNKYLASNVDSFVTAITTTNTDPGLARMSLENRLQTDYPNVNIKDRREVTAAAEEQIDRTLAIVNVLLLLSAAIAVLGITIALFMAVLERTREIGMMRAIGTQRKQIRWTVRWEGVIVALFGGFFGTVVGACLGIVATQKLPEYLISTITIPYSQLFVFTTLIGLSGVVAGVLPAIIAARVKVLEAING